MVKLTDVLTTSIANGAALSGAVNVSDYESGVVLMPAAWTAASIGFQVSGDNSTYYPLYDEGGTLVEMTVAVDKGYQIPAEVFCSKWVKLWSETSGSGVNQGAARTLKLILKK